jgi:hypothetical protein
LDDGAGFFDTIGTESPINDTSNNINASSSSDKEKDKLSSDVPVPLPGGGGKKEKNLIRDRSLARSASGKKVLRPATRLSRVAKVYC